MWGFNCLSPLSDWLSRTFLPLLKKKKQHMTNFYYTCERCNCKYLVSKCDKDKALWASHWPEVHGTTVQGDSGTRVGVWALTSKQAQSEREDPVKLSWAEVLADRCRAVLRLKFLQRSACVFSVIKPLRFASCSHLPKCNSVTLRRALLLSHMLYLSGKTSPLSHHCFLTATALRPAL